jgi:hypothetical protein
LSEALAGTVRRMEVPHHSETASYQFTRRSDVNNLDYGSTNVTGFCTLQRAMRAGCVVR